MSEFSYNTESQELEPMSVRDVINVAAMAVGTSVSIATECAGKLVDTAMYGRYGKDSVGAIQENVVQPARARKTAQY